MAEQDGISFDGNEPLSKDHKQIITSYLHTLIDSADGKTITRTGTGKPPKPEQLSELFQFLDDHYWSTISLGDEKAEENDRKKRPTLLNIRSGNGMTSVAATHFNLCSEAIGIDHDPRNITSSKTLAFQQKVFNKCHFFQIENMAVDPKILLDNPHFMADKINETDVVFLYVLPVVIEALIPLLALLSSKKKERKFVTLVNHIPAEFALRPRFISGTELCVYDGVVDNRVQQVVTIPPPPEAVDEDDIDKEFARNSIRHALPERLR